MSTVTYQVKRICGIATNASRVDSSMDNIIEQHLFTLGEQFDVAKTNTCVFSITETVEPDQWIDYVDLFCQQVRTRFTFVEKIFLALDITYDSYSSKISLANVNGIVYVDFDFISLYYGNGTEVPPTFNEQWNSHSDKFLFLVGKANKLNRIRLLQELEKSNALDSCTFSLQATNNELDDCRKFLPNLSTVEQDQFFDRVNNTVVDYEIRSMQNAGNHPALPTDKLFATSLFNLVAETWFDRPYWAPMITEKSYKPILNHSPFIIAGDLFTCKELQNRGFRTFNQYLLIPNYDNPDEPDFLQCRDGSMPAYYQEHLLDFYQNIKLEDWPHCNSIDQYNSLPMSIQDECKSAFQYPILDINLMRLKAVVANCKFWVNSISKYKKQIEIDIEHNAQHAKKLIKVYNTQWQQFATEYSIQDTLKGLVFKTYRYGQIILNQ